MDAIMKSVFGALRSSEFWMLLAQAYVEVASAPVPDEFKAAGWLYIVARVGSKVFKFVFPDGINGKWFAADPK